mmetsp:Transcript_176761/g.566942  ORF Transcript_176761/g.566942 Transcript_176761/m.566942 type:complete len:271 (-) Transcript_176761:35-847(-)
MAVDRPRWDAHRSQLCQVVPPAVHHLRLQQHEHKECQQRVIPILVHEPEEHAKHLENKEGSDGVLLEQLPEGWQRNVVDVRAVPSSRICRFLARQALGAHILLQCPPDVESQALELQCSGAVDKASLLIRERHLRALALQRNQHGGVVLVRRAHQRQHSHMGGPGKIRLAVEAHTATRLHGPLRGQEKRNMQRRGQEAPQEVLEDNFTSTRDKRSNNCEDSAIHSTKRQAVEGPILRFRSVVVELVLGRFLSGRSLLGLRRHCPWRNSPW